MKIEIGTPAPTETGWLTTEDIASVFVTSQEPGYPIESIFEEKGAGWRAASPGVQIIRAGCDAPRPVRRIKHEFSEGKTQRTQESVLQWASSADGERRQLMRQQWNFSPQGSTSEIEDVRVNLEGVLLLELTLRPDIGNGPAVGSLKRFQIS